MRPVVADDVRVPAGWYPDPLGLPQLRWWDNHAWTEHTSDARQPMMTAEQQATQSTRLAWADDEEELPEGPADEAPATTTAEPPSRRSLRDQGHLGYSPETAAETMFGPTHDADTDADTDGVRAGVDTATAFGDPVRSLEAPARDQAAADEVSPAARYLRAGGRLDDAPTSLRYDLDEQHEDLLGAPTPPRSATGHASGGRETYLPEHSVEPEPLSTRRRTAVAAPGHTSTGPVWILTVIPLYALMVGMLVLLGGVTASLGVLTFSLAIAVPWLAGLVLAYVDRRMLLRAGMSHPAHWLWALGGAPVYLVARLVATVKETASGFGPLLTHVVLGVFTLGAVLAVPGLLMIFTPATFSREAEISVMEDARSLGAELTVDCPTVPPLLVQQSFRCEATGEDGRAFDVTVSLQRSNGWIDWRVDDWGVFSI